MKAKGADRGSGNAEGWTEQGLTCLHISCVAKHSITSSSLRPSDADTAGCHPIISLSSASAPSCSSAEPTSPSFSSIARLHILPKNKRNWGATPRMTSVFLSIVTPPTRVKVARAAEEGMSKRVRRERARLRRTSMAKTPWRRKLRWPGAPSMKGMG